MSFLPVLTPKKVYCRSNICVLCSFSFIVTEIAPTGEKIEHKRFKEKLKLTTDRIKVIKQVVSDFDVIQSPGDSNGVCLRCFRRVEKVINLRKEIEKLDSDIKTNLVNVRNVRFDLPSPRKVQLEKRLLRSPAVPIPAKKQQNVFASFSAVQTVKIPQLSMPVQSQMSQMSFRQLQPKVAITIPIQQASDPLPAGDTASIIESIPEVKKPARKSLGFSGKENKKPSPPEDGTIKVTIYYPSGKKSTNITNEAYQKICKALIRSTSESTTHIDEVIVDSICTSNPVAIVSGSAKIIKNEVKIAVKRGSGSILQKKEHQDFTVFNWVSLYDDLEKHQPGLLHIISSLVADTPPPVQSKPYIQTLVTAVIGIHARNQEMSLIHYMIGLLLLHGGCTQRDIERLSSIGLCVHPATIKRKLTAWHDILDKEIRSIRNSWALGGTTKYQLVGDNWDRNILPSFRTSDRRTLSLHLFNMYAIVDRVIPKVDSNIEFNPNCEISIDRFIPSVEEQEQLMQELCFILSSSIIENHPEVHKHFANIYPKHRQHKYSEFAGLKTKQYPLGLYDCNENKTPELIQLLKTLSTRYVPCNNGEVVEPVLFGGDRLTDERVQSAQKAMSNAGTALQRLEGFISKIEDFHRLMNFLEAIHKLTYNTKSAADKCTVYYFRNLLNMRNVKGHVYNAYRAYKLLYYVIMDALCLMLFLHHLGLNDVQQQLQMPDNFSAMTDEQKIHWIDQISKAILRKWFFDDDNDLCENLRDILIDPDHPENYWVTNLEDGRIKCHHCDKSYAHVGSLQSHELKIHNVKIEKPKKKVKDKNIDQVQDHLIMLFKLILLHKNLDTAVDMGDGECSVRSAKYELPIYNITNKIKYSIGSIHLTALVSGILPCEQKERLIANRFVNLQGGKNNNISLDEYLEMLNRDSKIASSGHQTKDSIISHSKEYPHLINFIHQFDEISNVRKKKGFHHLPNYKNDVLKVLKELQEADVLTYRRKRSFIATGLECDRNPFKNSYKGLSNFIHRHKPKSPYIRLRDPTI